MCGIALAEDIIKSNPHHSRLLEDGMRSNGHETTPGRHDDIMVTIMTPGLPVNILRAFVCGSVIPILMMVSRPSLPFLFLQGGLRVALQLSPAVRGEPEPEASTIDEITTSTRLCTGASPSRASGARVHTRQPLASLPW